MKIALVHDYLTQFGGGERVLNTLCEMFPEAPIFTLIYSEKGTGSAFKDRKIYTSFLQKIPGAKKFFRGLIWLMPLAVEQFNLSDFDLVISISHSFGKGIITRPTTKHICYCLTPTRYLWFTPTLMHELWGHSAGITILKPFLYPLLAYLRTWDFQASQRPDYFIACSENVKQRIKKYYGRESEVIYPPVERATREYPVRSFSSRPARDSEVVGRFASLCSDQAKTASESAHQTLPCGLSKISTNSYFLMVGRMVPYKRFDLAIEAFSKLPEENLLIIGDGPEYKNLKFKNQNSKLRNIKFLGRVSDLELPKYYANCKALIFPQEEDFGIVALEAMASGRPVIAYRAGGALETVKDGETGILFEKQTPESLVGAVKKFNSDAFNSQKIRHWAGKFDKEIFKKKFTEFLLKT